MRMELQDDCYTYHVFWSNEDEEHIGTCLEFPSLSWLDATSEAALSGIRKIVADVVTDLKENGEPIPDPLSTQS